MAIISGHGATLGFGTATAFAPDYTSIGEWSGERPALDSSSLTTTGARTKVPGDLYDIGSFTASFFYEIDVSGTGDDNSLDDLLYNSGSAAPAETVTLTYPDTNGSTIADTTAFVTGFTFGELTTDTLIQGDLTVQWGDWPTITEGTP